MVAPSRFACYTSHVSTDALKHLTNDQIIARAVRGELTETQIKHLDPDLARLALIAAVQTIGQLRTDASPITPSTPSGQQPVYAKPKQRTRSGKKPGAKPGHTGYRRPTPEQVDRRETHEELKRCPKCDGKVHPAHKHRKRIIVDLPLDLSTETVEHTIPRQWCSGCKRYVEPVVADAIPKATIGHRAAATLAWFHYGLGITIHNVTRIFSQHLNTHLSAGGLVAIWQRMADEFEPWYKQIGEEAKRSSHLHADETGWRVNGHTHWLWCFTNPRCCYFMIDPSRGSPALLKFFTEDFNGILITDFWRAYEWVNAAERQYCLVHLLREIETVDARNASEEWRAFAKMLKRLIRDGVRLRKRSEQPAKEHPSRVKRIDERLNALADGAYVDADAKRLAKRLSRHSNWLFTFLNHPEVPWENNFAERQIRPAVILRKNSQSNRSERGAATQAVLMSIFRTLELRGHDAPTVIADAMRQRLINGQLPPLPPPVVAGG